MRRIIVVGNALDFHLGHYLEVAAKQINLSVKLCNVEKAFEGPLFFRKYNWWIRGRRPVRMTFFEKEVLAACREFRPEGLVATGIAPMGLGSLEAIKKMGIQSINFLTDDPWNPAHRAAWFLEALPSYDRIFTPRRANMEDLRVHGCQRVDYLPFGYSPEVHYPEFPQTKDERKSFECDVVFVGGADKDRVPYVRSLVKAGVEVRLYGGYWGRHSDIGNGYYGMADLPTLRKATGSAKVSLCLVRRANRDGHCMHTFEGPAMRGCMLVEDTPDHREIFGPEGQAALYFKHEKEMVIKAKFLISNPAERNRLAVSAHELVTKGKNTYRDRLASILEVSP